LSGNEDERLLQPWASTDCEPMTGWSNCPFVNKQGRPKQEKEMKKKTKDEKKIPMTNCDRAQALLRISEYLEDLKDIKKGYNHDKLKKFCRKYHLDSPIIDHEFVAKYTRENIQRIAIFTDDQVISVKPYERARTVTVSFKSKDGQTIEKVPKHDLSPWLREGRYLTIEIDLTRNIKEIMSKIKKEISFWNKYYVDKPETRSKETFYSPWEVYDLYKGGKNFSQIARQLSDRDGNPSYNPKLMAEYKNVKRAYDKACEMISQVEKDIKSTTHLSK
jgi:hypothetical protein